VVSRSTFFTGWSVLNRRSVYKPDISPDRFGMSVKLAENYNAVNIITPSRTGFQTHFSDEGYI
jgi:hypothetical protein